MNLIQTIARFIASNLIDKEGIVNMNFSDYAKDNIPGSVKVRIRINLIC